MTPLQPSGKQTKEELVRIISQKNPWAEIDNPRARAIADWMGDKEVGDVFSPSALGITKKAVIKKAVEALKDPSLSPVMKEALKSDLQDLIKVIKATPEKALKDIKDVFIFPGKRILGHFTPSFIAMSPHPTHEIWSKIGDDLADSLGNMAHSFAHEGAGHGGTSRIYERLFRRLRPEEEVKRYMPLSKHFHSITDYTSGRGYAPQEGAAEYIATITKQKAGLDPTPLFGHGEPQREVFERLASMPARNPWLNVRTYFKEILK